MNMYLLAAETAAAGGGKILPGWVDELAILAIQILGPILIMLAGWAAVKLAKKFGIEETAAADKLGRDRARQALLYAERWAKKAGLAETPGGPGKLEKALDRLIVIEGHVNVGEILRDKLSRRIHTELEAVENGAADT